ncbi:hypothetical protein Dsin_001303 [Dipteronia sinensis]|uniref:Uncharacterized protein n=1 Tax=Dipteronia sinensis TaxID=43782 RepID=A0AAE0B4W3_9ROSI|nr:hypothetical protein Dsin_001303 [Dipteronia sinensis]
MRLNQAVHGDGKQVLENVVCWSREYLGGFHEAIMHVSDQSGRAMLNVPRWQPPNEGFYKLNMDAALDERNQRVGLGDRLWQFYSDFGLSPVVVESDALGVVNLFNANSLAAADIGLIVWDINDRRRSVACNSIAFVPIFQLMRIIFGWNPTSMFERFVKDDHPS